MKKAFAIIIAAIALATQLHATTNEITVQVVFQATKGSAQVSRQPGTIQAQWIGSRYSTRIYDLTTTNTILDAAGITTPGWAYFRNVSLTGTVDISSSNGAITNMMLLPGEMSLQRLKSTNFSITNIQAAASAGTVQLEATIIEQ